MFAPQRPRPGDISVQPPSIIKSPAAALSTISSNSTRSFSSPSQNKDLELGQASSVSNYRSKHPTQSATLKETRQKILARRTFWATLTFGVLTLLYEAVSLLPAFHSSWSAAQGVNIQVKSEADSRQALAYSFLQECWNRKTQNLPLGEDCIRNLAKTPKAPPDIDDWLVPSKLSATGALYSRYVSVSPDNWSSNWWSGLVTSMLVIFALLRTMTDEWRALKLVVKERMKAPGVVTAIYLLLEIAHLLHAWCRHQR